jgi:hypothetical protein
MDDKKTKVTGTCFCGAVRFEIELPTRFCVHCHCTMCRRIHGAGFVTWFAIPTAQLRMTAGEEKLATYRSSDHGTRSFCVTCGSSLFCASTHHPDVIDVVLANMDGAIDRPPESHIFYSDHAPWVVLGDKLPRLGGATGMELIANSDPDPIEPPVP